MTPIHFTEAALAWLAAGVTICKYIQAQLLPLIASLTQSVTDLKARQDRHGEQISTLSGNLTQVALLTPPPSTPAPAAPQPASVVVSAGASAPSALPAGQTAAPPLTPASGPGMLPPAGGMLPPAGMTEAQAIAANATMQPAPPAISGVSQEM